MDVFVLIVLYGFNLSRLPKDYENVFEICESGQFRNKISASTFVSATIRALDENFLTPFKKDNI